MCGPLLRFPLNTLSVPSPPVYTTAALQGPPRRGGTCDLARRCEQRGAARDTNNCRCVSRVETTPGIKVTKGPLTYEYGFYYSRCCMCQDWVCMRLVKTRKGSSLVLKLPGWRGLGPGFGSDLCKVSLYKRQVWTCRCTRLCGAPSLVHSNRRRHELQRYVQSPRTFEGCSLSGGSGCGDWCDGSGPISWHCGGTDLRGPEFHTGVQDALFCSKRSSKCRFVLYRGALTIVSMWLQHKKIKAGERVTPVCDWFRGKHGTTCTACDSDWAGVRLARYRPIPRIWVLELWVRLSVCGGGRTEAMGPAMTDPVQPAQGAAEADPGAGRGLNGHIQDLTAGRLTSTSTNKQANAQQIGKQ